MYVTLGADQTAQMHMFVCAFVVRTCMLHKVLIRLRGCACLSVFFFRTCMLHKALIRLRGCACFSLLLLYVHVCYIRR